MQYIASFQHKQYSHSKQIDFRIFYATVSILYIDPGFNMLGLQISDYYFGQMYCQVNPNLRVGQIQFNSITNAPQQHFRQCSVALQLENILISS